ncbi:hypothetical protein FKM82_010267 [Ascaphus truei]
MGSLIKADMDDDDDSGLLDFIGDPQALNYFLHGPGSKSAGDELTSVGFSASNSNSIFAIGSHADSKSSIKGVHSQMGDGSSDGLQLSNSFQFLEDELESSPIPDLSEDQPFDILQKSLQEANITEQTLAEEAYLDASIGSNQQFANVPLNSHSSASFTQASNVPNYSGQTLHSVGVTHVPVVQQQVGPSFSGNTVGVQHGFMQHVGISIPSQQMSNSNHSNSGQIQLIGSFNNQSPMMTINNLDGSQIILKGGQQSSANASGGLLVQRQSHNGNAMFGSPPSSGNFQSSLPVHNIIIQRGLAPNANKMPINIQPKPVQVEQYNVNNLGMQQHHIHQGVPFVPGNSPQNSAVGQQMPVNIANQQSSRKPFGQQPGGSIVIHSPMGQPHGHSNQFLIPTGLSVNSSSVHHVQTINAQLVQTQPSHLVPNQVSADHVMLNRNTTNMVRPNQPYSGQMLNSPNTALQLVPGQTFTGPGGQVILNHGSSQMVGGQMPQVSPTVLHLSPGQGNTAQGRSSFTSVSSGGPNMSAPNRFTVVSSGTMLQSMGQSFQTSTGGEHFIEDQQQKRTQDAINESHHLSVSTPGSQQTFSCGQIQKNHISPMSSLKTQDSLRQQHLPTIMGNASLTGHNAGGKHLQHSLAMAQLQEKVGLHLQNVEVEGHPGGLKRPASKQLTKGSLILQQLHKDQEHSVLPDTAQFRSLNDAVHRLLPYHVLQGTLPTKEDLQKVDNEFESVATQLLKKTQSMLNKYRLLLLEDAMRINPSAEMVMLDRMFNQEERATLTREKRFALVDPDSYLADFCCINKFQEGSAEEKQSSNHDVDTEKSLTDAFQTVKTPKQDQTDLTVSRNHDKHHLVPNNSVTLQKVNISSIKKEGLNKHGKLKKIGWSPGNQLLNTYKKKVLHDKKSNECPSKPEVICKASKETDNSSRPKIPNDILESSMEIVGEKPLQDKAPGPSPESDDRSADISGSPGKLRKDLMHSKTLKPTLKNILELKLSGKNLKNEVSGRKSAELECPKPSPTASQENCVDKTISDTSEETVETDSVLEAAVNSILEC